MKLFQDGTYVFWGVFIGYASSGARTATESIIALAVCALCTFVLLKRASAANTTIRASLLRSFGIYTGCVAVAGLLRCILNGVLFEYFGTIVALVPLLWGARVLCDRLDDAERQLNVPAMFNIAFVCILLPILWVAMNAGAYNKDVFHYPLSILATITSFFLARSFFTLEMVADLKVELPESPHEPRFSKNTLLMFALAAAIAFRFVVYFTFDGRLASSFANVLSDASIQISFFFMAVAIGYMALRRRIRRFVFGNSKVEATSYADVWVLIFSIVCGFIASFISGFSVAAGIMFKACWLICVIAEAINCAVGEASGAKRAIYATIVTLLGLSFGSSILTIALFVVVILVMARFLNFEMHDMLSFGHSVQGYDDDGNFVIINTATGLDQDGNKWRKK